LVASTVRGVGRRNKWYSLFELINYLIKNSSVEEADSRISSVFELSKQVNQTSSVEEADSRIGFYLKWIKK
jgi:hypothetical protein